MATHKAASSTKNGRTSNPKYRGVKVFGGQIVKAGNIIVRQVGNLFFPGEHIVQGRDFTLLAKKSGFVKFHKGWKNRTYISIVDTL